jgi:predicted amidohydrolase
MAFHGVPVNSIKFAGLQMAVSGDIHLNESKIMAALTTAAEDKADFLLTPEGSLSGYTPHFDPATVSQALGRVTAAAKGLGVGLFLGTCFVEPDGGRGLCYNQLRVYSPDGAYLGYYAKILRCSPPGDPAGGEVRDYAPGTLKLFEFKGVKIGALICNDLWATPGYTCLPNPYLPLQLKRMGAQVIVQAVNSGPDPAYLDFHRSSTELWALTLRLPIVAVNAAPGDGGLVSALSGVTGPDGKALHHAAASGERYFTYNVAV